MSRYVDDNLRRQVIERARSACEYCLIHEDDTYFGCHVDHIISLKHGGPTISENLAYACGFCNRRKGSDIGSIHWPTGQLIRFFHPRRDRWRDHFRLDDAFIRPTSDIGRVTARILGFNDRDRVFERQTLMNLGRYPPESIVDW